MIDSRHSASRSTLFPDRASNPIPTLPSRSPRGTGRRESHTISIALAAAFLFLVTTPAQSANLDVPYVPTPLPVVERMLDMAQVGPGDYVIDLGSGDGRIVIAAAQRGATGHGVDLDPDMVREAEQNARLAGVVGQAMFLEENIFETDFSRASVVTMYLLNKINLELRPSLLERLRPGTRVVSHDFSMGDWEPDAQARVREELADSMVYMWIIPARLQGRWSWQIEGESWVMDIEQTFQYMDAQIRVGDQQLEVIESTVRGDRVQVRASGPGRRLVFNGRVTESQQMITGTMQVRRANQRQLHGWTAVREPSR
jgi:SAM-dependent methyltransferase